MNNRKLLKLESLLIVAVFAVSVFVPLVYGVIEKDKKTSRYEKRFLADFPPLPNGISSMQEYPELFDDYYSDHFGLRGCLTTQYKWMKFRLGDSPSDDVTIGKDGWLFLGAIKNKLRYDDPIGDARNANVYTEEELARIVERFDEIEKWLSERDVKYLFFIAPDKHTIYFENLPSYITKVRDYSAADQLYDVLQNRNNIKVVDLREDLVSNKENLQLYFKVDTHWNHHGANIVQYKIAKALEELFPGKINKEFYDQKTGLKTNGDLVRYLGLKGINERCPMPIFRNPESPELVSENEFSKSDKTYEFKDQKLKGIFFGDSFMYFLEPYFSRQFRESTFVKGKFNREVVEKYLEKEKPDVVIEEWAERVLPFVPESASD